MNNVWSQGLVFFNCGLAPSSGRYKEDHRDLYWSLRYTVLMVMKVRLEQGHVITGTKPSLSCHHLCKIIVTFVLIKFSS